MADSDERVPTEPGWWWRDGIDGPVRVAVAEHLRARPLWWEHESVRGLRDVVEDDGAWRGRAYTREDVVAAARDALATAQMETCRHCGARPFIDPFPSGQEPPIVRGALDAQAETERAAFALAKRTAEIHDELEVCRAQLATVTRERDEARRGWARALAHVWGVYDIEDHHREASGLFGAAEADRLFPQTKETEG